MRETPQERREGIAFLLNEVDGLRRSGVISADTRKTFLAHYIAELSPIRQPAPAPTLSGAIGGARPLAAPSARGPGGPPAPPAVPQLAPGWLVEQQANLLLYLGAFLIVIAALILVGFSGETLSGGPKMALLSSYTLAFLAAGGGCMRFPRVRQAGLVFFGVGSLLVPLSFVGAYVFFDGEGELEANQLLLAGSLTSALFYGAVAFLGISRWYSVSCLLATGSALFALLVLIDAPPQAWPPAFAVYSFAVSSPSWLKLRLVSDIFGETGQWVAHVALPVAVILTWWQAAVDEVVDARLWFDVSLTALVYYVTGALLWAGFPYVMLSIVAAGASLAALLAVSAAPPEAYPPSFVALALVLVIPSQARLGVLGDLFAEPCRVTAHFLAPVVALFGVTMIGTEPEVHAYLPVMLGLATAFYAVEAFSAGRRDETYVPYLDVIALTSAGATAVSVVYALDLGLEWYGPATAMVAWGYALASLWRQWRGRQYLAPLALTAVTVSWLALEGVYVDSPRQGAGVHFAAVAFYVLAAIRNFEVSLIDPFEPREPREYLVPLSVPLVYLAGIALALGFYYLLSALPAAEGAEGSDLAWPYFGLSVGIAILGAGLRWWRLLLRAHVYAVAAAMSLFVLLVDIDNEGRVALALMVYATLSLALVLWEREAPALPVPAAYGFFALLAAWRHFQPPDEYLPLVFSGAGSILFVFYYAYRSRLQRWPEVCLLLALVYLVAAPVIGWVRLDTLANPEGYVGSQHFAETLLYQTSAASVLVVGIVIAALSRLLARWDIAVGASLAGMVALLLEVGHFRPENVQWYTAPLALYLLGGALLLSRLKDIPIREQELSALEAAGAVLLMGPTLLQSMEEGAWAYGVVLLVEGIALVGLSLIRRRLWLLGTSTAFVVLNGLHYLFFAGGPALPNWAILSIAGTAVMAAGTLILLGREQWTHWHQTLLTWWNEPYSDMG
jgi:hypothetical protein